MREYREIAPENDPWHGLCWTAIHHWKSRYATDNGLSADDIEPITA